MLLRRVRVSSFRGLTDRTVDLLGPGNVPRPLTVLVGPNMSGKTTFLDAIHLAYEGVANARKPAWRPGLDPYDPTLRGDPNQPIEVTIEFSLHDGELEAMRELETALGGSLAVSPADSFTFTFQCPPPDASSHGVTGSHPGNAHLAFRGRPLASLALSRKIPTVTEKYLDRVGGVFYLDQARRGRLYEYAARSTLPLRRSPFPRDVLGFLANRSLLAQKWDPESQGESGWSRCKRLFKQLAPPAEIDDIKASDDNFDLRLKRRGGYYYSSGTSSGERQLLRLVANLVYCHAIRSVVLIDEVELNLHPRWQRSLLHFCQSGGDDDNQFIVTTHSETLLRYVDPKAVVVFGELDAS